ncbi:DNA repair endonuclease XPF [Toxorhynchites rutilus septentrionalis]|uniref:DNA repair endonuclease XPF n=1 Tax=Toxorhynchites rutilus septentrionalis TaxID=329112 RepID=UPI002478B58B|nr:DNA repair endonuclease XPF [Toxorhynchites rutilus septentrionalis]
MDEAEDDVDSALACSAEQAERQIQQCDEIKREQELSELVDAEEFLASQGIPMLEYERQMFLDLLHSDGLVVCAKGISYEKVLLNLLKIFSDPTTLVLVINSSDYEEKLYASQLNNEHVHESSTNATERERVYSEGGIHFISTRILVVDLLKNRIPIELITGIFVVKAHEIIESCQEAFALRLYRQKNKTGFIKAFSKNVEAFTYGYGHVEKVMRNLFVKELFIWPRFHATIQQSLKPFEPLVVEMQVPMSQNMILLQTNILDIMNYLIKNIKSLNHQVELQEVTVENCVTKKFHKILQAQLDTIWHQLSSQTKLIVADLRILRSLMISTIYHDAVTLYATMRKYRSAEYALSNSGWTILDSAERIFTVSKDRVFNKSDEFEPELCPKWKILSEVLRQEIPLDIKETAKKIRKDEERRKYFQQQVKVLILCQDARTCYQLNEYLTQGAEKCLFYMAMKNDVTVSKLSERYRHIGSNNEQNPFKIQNIDSYAKLTKSVAKESALNAESSAGSLNKEGDFLRDRIAKRRKEVAAKEASETNAPSQIQQDDEDILRSSIASKVSDMEADLPKNEEEDEYQYFRDSYILTMSQKPEANDTVVSEGQESSCFDVSQFECGEFESFQEMENLDVTKIVNESNKPLLFIQTFKSENYGFGSLERTLDDIKPRYIVLYHSHVAAIRQIEIYEARQQRQQIARVRVFVITHSKTVEEQSYLTSLRREKQAFELLIETKRTMVIPEYQDGKSDDSITMLQKTQDISSRQAGGQLGAEEAVVTPQIIVDMREFRSDLPCLIHRRGIEVVPLTITIGDYILTPEICVERKSISDLIGSLNSGRLYSQCVQMSRCYSKPILLIEFDQNKPFHLQRHFMMSGDSASSNADITQKLQLLTLHFPKLKLVWSPSPYATAQLFEELKHGKQEPNPDVAVLAGSDEAGGLAEMERIADRSNPNIHDFIIKLPGINSKNIGKAMRKCKNLKELLRMSESELAELLSSQVQAKMLWEILHVVHKPTPSDLADKQFGSKFKRGFGKPFLGVSK